jgi:hypothetical protein
MIILASAELRIERVEVNSDDRARLFVRCHVRE